MTDNRRDLDGLGIPVLRLELELDSMRYHICTALLNHNEELQKRLDIAFERMLTADSVDKLFADAAGQAIKEAIQRCVREYFLSPEVANAVHQAVRACLRPRITREDT